MAMSRVSEKQYPKQTVKAPDNPDAIRAFYATLPDGEHSLASLQDAFPHAFRIQARPVEPVLPRRQVAFLSGTIDRPAKAKSGITSNSADQVMVVFVGGRILGLRMPDGFRRATGGVGTVAEAQEMEQEQ